MKKSKICKRKIIARVIGALSLSVMLVGTHATRALAWGSASEPGNVGSAPCTVSLTVNQNATGYSTSNISCYHHVKVYYTHYYIDIYGDGQIKSGISEAESNNSHSVAATAYALGALPANIYTHSEHFISDGIDSYEKHLYVQG